MGKPQTIFDRISNSDNVEPFEAERLPGRAGELQAKFQPLSQIEPVLSSLYLVKGWLNQSGLSVVYGDSNVGKTFFALDLAMHVAAGQDWHGARVAASSAFTGGVVYVASEGDVGIRNRIEAIRRDRADLCKAADRKHGFTLLPASLNLSSSDDATQLAAAIENLPTRPRLIIIDTLARNMGDGDENTARDMGAFVSSCDHLREAVGAHVMVIHHSGKDASKGARGSGSLRAAVDTEMLLTKDGLIIQAETRKQRDMKGGELFAYSLRDVEIGTDEDGQPVTAAVVDQTEPVKKKPKISGQPRIALQALDDALHEAGEFRSGEQFPQNRRCVSLDKWREWCGRHELSVSGNDGAFRTAFSRACSALQNDGVICIVDKHVWRC